MTSCPVLRCLAPRLPVLSVGFGSVFCSMPLGRIAGPPVTPLSLTIPARKSATICFSAAFSASRRSVRASRSPRDSSERGIFSGTDMLGTNRVRYEQGQPRSSSYLPGFLPQVLSLQDKALLKARNMADIGHIKEFSSLNLSRHRSVINAFVHIIAAITAYQINPFKPKLNLQPRYQLETTA